tara:strand:+ start:278 stop:640 length:363 start_codon:yes stop_codon:yes gene_type:complete
LFPLENETLNNSSLPVILPKNIDRVKCKESYSHQYCYNGRMRQKDIFRNYIEYENYEYYPQGNTYDIEDTIGILSEYLYSVSDLDRKMLYNPITNIFIGQLSYGDYKMNDCSGILTKCMN